MTRAPRGTIITAILEALRDFGPMTVVELCEHVPQVRAEDVRKTAARMAKPVKRGQGVGTRRIHVSAWTHDAEGLRKYPRPIYSMGDGDNKPRPPRINRNEIARNWMRKRRAQRRTNFVFNLAAPVKHLRSETMA